MSKKEKKSTDSGDTILKTMMGVQCLKSIVGLVVAVFFLWAVWTFVTIQKNKITATYAQPVSNQKLEYADVPDAQYDFYIKEKEIERAGEFQSAALPRMAEIEILHVGQGGCVVFRDEDVCTLIDVGGPEDGALIGAHLNDLGISKIDVVLTTTDIRHHGGLSNLAEWVDIQKVYTTASIANEISLSGYAVEKISQCSSWHSGPYVFHCLASSDVAVMRVIIGNYSLVYLSNLSAEYESELIDARFAGMDVTADFLVAASHAEQNTNGEEVLTLIGATQNFIQMDEDEVDPCLKTVNRLHKFATTWRTDRFDTCVIHTDGVEYTMRQEAGRNCNG